MAKVQKLDPSYKDTIPWKPRGYSRKRSHDSHVMSFDPAETATSKKLCSPLLEKEHSTQSPDNHVTYNAIANDFEEIQGPDKETRTSPYSPPKTTKFSTNLLGLDYSSSEDES